MNQQKRQTIRVQLPKFGSILIFWMLVVAIPLLAGKIIAGLYLEHNLHIEKKKTEFLLIEDLERFSDYVQVEPFIEKQIAETEKEFGLPDPDFASSLPAGVDFLDGRSAKDLTSHIRSSYQAKMGFEPLFVFVAPGDKSLPVSWVSDEGEAFAGFIGRAAVRILLQGLSQESGFNQGSAPPIFWQILKSVFGSDFSKNLQNRSLNSTFSQKSGGRRLFVYFNFFPGSADNNGSSGGYLTAFTEDQVSRQLNWRWAFSNNLKAGIHRTIKVLPTTFKMNNSFDQGFLQAYKPLPIRALRVGSHLGRSRLQKNVENGFWQKKPARYYFLVAKADLNPILAQHRKIDASVAIVFLILGFLALHFLRIFALDGRINLRIRSKLFVGILTATILPMLLFFVFASQYFDFYRNLLVSHSAESMRQHLQMLELNIRNNEQQRYRRVEKFKEELNRMVEADENQITAMLESELGKLYHGYFMVRSDGLILERIPMKEKMNYRDLQRLKMITDLFKGSCLRVFKELGILGGHYFDRLKETSAGRQLIGYGEMYDPSDLKNFCLQDGQYFSTDKAENGIYQFATFNLLPDRKQAKPRKMWGFLGFIQDISEITSGYLNSHPENWKFFIRREAGMLINTAVFAVDAQEDGFKLGRCWPNNLGNDPEFLAAAARIRLNNPEESWVSWQTVPVIYAVRKLDKIPFIAVSQGYLDTSSGGNGGLLVLLLALMLYCIILILIIALIISDFFMKPLNILLKATGMVNQGVFPQIEFKAGHELAQVVGRFNEMTIGMIERRNLERFVSSEATRTIEREILQQQEHTGERITATIVFVHIKGFDELCESLQPDQLIALLNSYFSVMEPVIQANHGVIDKYIGDAIMVVFTDEADKGRAAVNACRGALEMLQRRVGLGVKLRAARLPEIEIGIGIAMGEVIRGKIGALAGRKDFTVIGDVVNLAARLESFSRQQSVAGIMVSGEVANICADDFVFQRCGETTLKGKSDKQLVFSLTGVKDG